MNFATRALQAAGDNAAGRARISRYLQAAPLHQETIDQMDAIGVGSLTIIILTGFFTGGVLTVQTFPTLKAYGAQSQTGYLVAVSLVRGEWARFMRSDGDRTRRIAISAELGSMVVSQQIDAMRAAPTRSASSCAASVALLVSLPLLTVLADVLGIFGGWVTAVVLYSVSSSVFISAVRDAITTDDLIGGVVKPIVFSLIIGTIACRQGLNRKEAPSAWAAPLRGPS